MGQIWHLVEGKLTLYIQEILCNHWAEHSNLTFSKYFFKIKFNWPWAHDVWGIPSRHAELPATSVCNAAAATPNDEAAANGTLSTLAAAKWLLWPVWTVLPK